MRRWFVLFGLLVLSLPGRGQQIYPEVSFHQIFDNREFFNSDYSDHYTIFGARVSGSAVFELDSSHRFAAGMSYMYEHGGALLGVEPTLNLYYHYQNREVQLWLGSFPRIDRVDLPLPFIREEFIYYRPNIQGGLLRYQKGIMDATVFADWISRVSDSTREQFMVGTDIKLQLERFYLRPMVALFHNARSDDPADPVNLQDNGILSLLGGYSFERENWSLEATLGPLVSMNRFRPDPFYVSTGIYGELDFSLEPFGARVLYYNGDPVEFEFGNPFFKAGRFTRLDLYVDPFKHKRISSKIGWNFHLVPGEGVHHSQQVLIDIRF